MKNYMSSGARKPLPCLIGSAKPGAKTLEEFPVLMVKGKRPK
jgi:hypothetical protein